jgi:hypothetical protein
VAKFEPQGLNLLTLLAGTDKRQVLSGNELDAIPVHISNAQPL